MSSFEEKVEALRRLREKRQARVEAGAKEKAPAVVSAQAEDLEGKELTDVLERYASHSKDLEHTDASRASPLAVPAQSVPESDNVEEEAAALYCLGHCFELGLHECEQSEAKAAEYYLLAAEKGSAVAQWRLGHLHEYGVAVECSDTLAAHWYRRAAEAGHPQAQSSLALFLEDGRGGPCDNVAAVQWHLAAAAQDQALSQYCAACCLAEGRGCERDEVQARAWLEKSASSGFPPAVEALNCRSSVPDKGPHESVDEKVLEASESCTGSLLDIAQRVARQLEGLPDDEAETFLDDLVRNMDDLSLPDCEDLEQALARSPLGASREPEAICANVADIGALSTHQCVATA
jgi:TPR repeat protein